MEFRRVESEAQYEFCRELYHEAFNDNERRDWELVIELQRSDRRFALYTIEKGGNMLGMVSIWHFDGFTYGEHLAISPDSRCGGIGAQVMKNIVSIAGNNMVLEVEPPITEIDTRRVGFYQRQGFTFVDRPYMQPAYSAQKSALPMNLMVRGDVDVERDFDSIVQTLHHNVYGLGTTQQ